MRFITVIAEFDISNIGIDLAEQFVNIGFVKTKSEARRFITQGAIKVSDRVVKDQFARLAHDGTEWVLIEHVQ